MGTSNFSELKSRHQRWIECVSSDDPNSVHTQLRSLVWSAAAFRIINAAWKMAPPAHEGGVQLNWLEHNLINKSFGDSQILAVRRLTDTYPIEGKNEVYSLKAVIRDMKRNVCLMTRQNLLSLQDEFRISRDGNVLPDAIDQNIREEREREIDCLCSTNAIHRSPEDTVKASVFDRLEKELDHACKNIRKYADKFVAHPATPQSRGGLKESPPLGVLWSAHKVLCQVADFLDAYLLTPSIGHRILIEARDDLFAYLDRPLASGQDDIGKLRDTWEAYRKEVESWKAFSPSEIAGDQKSTL